MRALKRKYPLKRQLIDEVPENAEAVAGRSSYIGSPEHKNSQSFAGRPAPRRDASLCEIRFAASQEMLTHWLQEGIRRGCCTAFGENDFPKYVWYKDADTVYEARLVNQGKGEYKGYPLSRAEWPARVENCHG